MLPYPPLELGMMSMQQRPLPHSDEANRVEPLAVDAESAAALFSSSLRTYRRWDASGRCPRGYSLGKKKIWLLSDLRAWASMGFPRRSDFERMMAEREENNAAQL